MLKYFVTCNPADNAFFSSRIIVDSLNQGAKELGLFDEKGVRVHYSHLCESHGYGCDAFISAYEVYFNQRILNNAAGKPIIGCSKDNMFFIMMGGYPTNKSFYVNLGIDTNLWKVQEKRLYKDKFVFLSFNESNVRSGLGCLIEAFGSAFKGLKDVVLYIKDRAATDWFKNYVKEKAAQFDVEIIHRDDNIEDWQDQLDIYASANVHVFPNFSSTWAMTVMQGLSCGIPTASQFYSGPRDYLTLFNSFSIPFTLEQITVTKLQQLESIGLKNHFFKDGYKFAPSWAEPNIEQLKNLLISIKDCNKESLQKIAENGRKTAEMFTWQRAALNMSLTLEEALK